METQTMTPVEVIVPCPSCARPMAFNELTHSHRCIACYPIPLDVPTCATVKCKRPLTWFGPPRNCWRCVPCNGDPDEVNKVTAAAVEQKKRPLLDVQMTEGKVEKMINERAAALVEEAMAKYNLKDEKDPDYPPSRAEIETMTAPETVNAEPESREETYMQKAKRLGVPTHRPDGGGMLKKEEVLAGIAAKEIETAQTPPSEDAELARGLTEEDMM